MLFFFTQVKTVLFMKLKKKKIFPYLFSRKNLRAFTIQDIHFIIIKFEHQDSK